jgi:hypothetical protein
MGSYAIFPRERIRDACESWLNNRNKDIGFDTSLASVIRLQALARECDESKIYVSAEDFFLISMQYNNIKPIF